MKHFFLFLLFNLPFLAFSQFSTSFESPDLSETWVGDRSSFTIKNGILTLQSQFSSGEKSKKVQLAHPYTLSSSRKEWSFYVNLNTKPTNSNYIQIYPQATEAESLDGFYIRIGHSKQGSQASRFSYGFDDQTYEYLLTGIEDETPTSIHFLIQLIDNKEWIIYVRNAYKENKLRLIKRIESITKPIENSYFGLRIVHTTSGNKKFGIEDILIQEATYSPEEEPAEEDKTWSDCSLDEIESLNAYEFKFNFSKAVNIDNATFSIEGKGYNGQETAIKTKIPEETPNVVIVRFFKGASSNEYYTLYWTGLKDSEGMPVKDGAVEGLFENTEEEPNISLSQKEVIINEIMANPKGFIPETEYIELHNCLDQTVKLKGCKLQYGEKILIPLDIVEIEAQGYAVLYRKGDEMNQDIVSYALELFPANLANAGKELFLYNDLGDIIDHYIYPQASPGKSWEFDKTGEWHLSTDKSGGTPGRANSPIQIEEDKPKEEEPELPDYPSKPEYSSPEPFDIIISEILPEPFIGGSEYIELFNRSERNVSLNDVAISTRKSDGSLNTAYSLADYPGTFKSGDYLLLTKSLEGVSDFYEMPLQLHVHECKLPILANSGASIVLYRKSDQEIIDEVHYSADWHNTSVKDKKGVALERIDLNGKSQDKSNWTSAASAAGGGTPGKTNSQQGSNASNEPPTGKEEISLLRFQPTGEYLMSYYLPQPGYFAKGWIFDIRGRKLSTLIENESLGTSGTIRWDGTGDDGKHLPSGVYIQYIELWNANGHTIRQKAAFLVH